jgi:RNA polymerase sigma-70 factor (ECF subfamily)
VALERIRPQFEPKTWQGFELAWLQNRPAADAAREVGRPVSFIYVAKSRVLERLREELLTLAEDIPLFVPLA